MIVIGLNTFRENLRDKILYNLLLFALVLLGLSIVLADLSIMEHRKMVTDIGLGAINLVGVMIAIFVGIGLVSKEIERRTVYTIMARPISRAQFLLGKYLGLVWTILLNLAIMVAVYHVTLWIYQAPLHWALFQALELILVELLLVTALALLFSTFTTPTLSATFTVGLYIVGHLTTDLRGLAEKSQHAMIRRIVEVVYYLCPNLEALNIKGQAAVGHAVSLSYQGFATVYGMAYTLALLTAACVIFQRRDF